MASEGTADPLAVTVAGATTDAPASTTLPPGTIVGRYVVTGVLGQGGMGVVYAAHDPDLDRPVALKLLRAELRTSRARLLREGQAVAKLSHPNVVTVHDIGAHGDDLFIAMERVRGETLGSWLRAAPERRRPWREVLARMIPAGRGLAAAHAAGLVHRDFKPENVLLGEGGRVVVTDFGLAQLGDEPDPERPAELGSAPQEPHLDLTRTGAVLGTPAYMSPEQFRGDKPDARSDQFSFCVTLYEALWGTRPFDPRDGTPPSLTDLASAVGSGRIQAALRGRDVPRWLRRAVRRGLRPDPAQRFPSMDALLAAIEPPARSRAVVFGLGAAAIAAAAIALVLASRRDVPLAAGIPVCESGDAIARVWNDDVRAAYRARHGDALWVEEELGWLDDYATRWRVRRDLVCLGGDEPRTAACLDDALAHLEAALARPHDLWPALDALDDCGRPPLRTTTFPLAVALGPQGVAALSPDGRRIVVSSFADAPYVIDADPRAYRPEPVADARIVGDWLPDGRMLIQRDDRTQRLQAPGGPATAVPGLGDVLHTQVNTIAPDGSRVAVAVDDGIVVLSTTDGAPLARVEGLAHEVAWEPDGRRLAIVSRNLSELRLLDTRSGSVVEIRLRTHARGLGEIGIAWLAPGRLLLSSATEPRGAYALWTLVFDDASRLARAPEIRLRAPDAQMPRVFDVAGGRALVETSSARQRIFRRGPDRVEELPAGFLDLRLSAIDRAAGVALAYADVHAVVFGLGDLAREIVPTSGAILPGLRGGRPHEVVPRGGGRWALVERRVDGEREILRFAWPLDAGAPSLRCSPDDTRRCVIWSRDRDTIEIAPLGDRALGEAVVLPRTTEQTLDLAGDGRRVRAPVGDQIVEVDLASGRRTTLARVGAPACHVRHVRLDETTGRIWVVLLCPDRFALGWVDRATTFQEVERSDGWISGLELLPGGDLLYSALDWDPQVVLVDRL